MKKILLADDHPIVRISIMQILTSGIGDVECGEAENTAAVFKKIREETWDMIVLDMEMPGRSGLEVLRQLKDERSKVHVLVFSSYPEGQMAVRVFKAGAYGYLSKDASREEIIKAVTQILEGRKYFTPQSTQLLVNQITDPQAVLPHALLSDREYDTLLLIGRGKTIAQIAGEFFLTIPTIHTLRQRILIKLCLKNSAELATYAIRHNLV